MGTNASHGAMLQGRMRSRAQCARRGYLTVPVPAVRFPPLGSPWLTLKRPYVHAPRVPGLGWCTGLGAGMGAYRVGGSVGYTGREYYPPTHPHWYCQGPTLPPSPVSASTQALQAPAGPSAHLGSSHSHNRPSASNGRDSASNILKLV